MTATTATPRRPSMAGMYRIPRAVAITNYLRVADFFAAAFFTVFFAAFFTVFFGALIALVASSAISDAPLKEKIPEVFISHLPEPARHRSQSAMV